MQLRGCNYLPNENHSGVSETERLLFSIVCTLGKKVTWSGRDPQKYDLEVLKS